jgi:hypothetical protein
MVQHPGILQGYSVLLADPDGEPGPAVRLASGAVAGGPHQALSHIGTVNHTNGLIDMCSAPRSVSDEQAGCLAWPGMCLNQLARVRAWQASAWPRGRSAGRALTGTGGRYMILIIMMDKDSYI